MNKVPDFMHDAYIVYAYIMVCTQFTEVENTFVSSGNAIKKYKIKQ